MATTVVMPKMGYDMTQGKIVQWLKKPGDRVEKGEPIAEIETEKVNIQIEAFTSGEMLKILVPEGETVPVGQPIALIGEPGEKPEEVPPPPPEVEKIGVGEGAEAAPLQVEVKAPEIKPVQPAPAAEEERVKASPVARRLAEEHGVELSRVQGTGPGGRITKEDVERFMMEAAGRRAVAPPPPPPPSPPAPGFAPPPPAPAPPATIEGVPFQTKELSRMGQAIARHMSESKRTIPHFYATVEIDMSRAVVLREELNRVARDEEKISYNDFVMKAAAVALTRFPMLNASYGEGKLYLYQQINMSMAVALEQGLIAPVIKDCDKKGLKDIARESRSLAARAKEGRLRQDEYGGGTFTVSNMGMLGVDEFAAIISPPQVAILAVGSVAQRPVVRDGRLDVAHTMRATLAVDHRVANGADAARYLTELKQLLEEPGKLL